MIPKTVKRLDECQIMHSFLLDLTLWKGNSFPLPLLKALQLYLRILCILTSSLTHEDCDEVRETLASCVNGGCNKVQETAHVAFL